ncbi:MAG: hypothetical protein RR614_01545 [Eubacterium sp.]
MKQHLRSSGFFVELIITIVFFAIACSIIVQLFAKAGLISREALDKRNAATQAQTICETVKAVGGVEKLPSYNETNRQGYGEYCFYYDDDWKNTDEAGAAFKVQVKLDEENLMYGKMVFVHIKAHKEANELYTVEAAQYFQEGQEGGEHGW